MLAIHARLEKQQATCPKSMNELLPRIKTLQQTDTRHHHKAHKKAGPPERELDTYIRPRPTTRREGRKEATSCRPALQLEHSPSLRYLSNAGIDLSIHRSSQPAIPHPTPQQNRKCRPLQNIPHAGQNLARTNDPSRNTNPLSPACRPPAAPVPRGTLSISKSPRRTRVRRTHVGLSAYVAARNPCVAPDPSVGRRVCPRH